jgi:hypothetical protein
VGYGTYKPEVLSRYLKDYFMPTTKNDLGVREFEEIIVEYPPEDLCTYFEYKGKPYFGIKYKENGEEIVGYGTYKPEVLSRYLKDYFMSTKKGNDCESNSLCTQRCCLKNHNIGTIECDEKYCSNRTKF